MAKAPEIAGEHGEKECGWWEKASAEVLVSHVKVSVFSLLKSVHSDSKDAVIFLKKY